MLNEEEKKAIEYLKKYCNTDLLYEQKHYDYINILIKSFEKQQKEIEGKNAVIDTFKHTEKVLTEQIDKQQEEIEELKNNELDYTTIYISGFYDGRKICKDKIKELKKGNRSLMESRKKWKNRYYKEKAKKVIRGELMQEFNYIQKYWFEDYLITQNCGYDENVGEYNGVTIYKANKEMKYKEVIHATLSGTKILTKQELENKIKNYEIINGEIEDE